MKIKIRPGDASVPEEDDWLQTNDWLAELRDDGRAEPAMAAPSRRAAAIPGQKALRPLPALRQLPLFRPVPALRPVPPPRPLPALRQLPLLRPVPAPR